MKPFKFFFLILLTICGYVFAGQTITIAASPVPQTEILKQVKPMLKQQGIDLQIKEFNDYLQPNLLVEQKQLDANFTVHRQYLSQFNNVHKSDLVELVGVHIEPMGLYASKKDKIAGFAKNKQISLLPQGSVIGIPNDTTNEGRSLLLLQKNGIFTLKSGVQFPTKKDIISNPYHIVIKELDPAMLPRVLLAEQLDLAVINSNFAMQSGINPAKDAIFAENADSPYVNIVVVRPDEINQPKMQALAKALHSLQVKSYIQTTYKGAVIPVF